MPATYDGQLQSTSWQHGHTQYPGCCRVSPAPGLEPHPAAPAAQTLGSLAWPRRRCRLQQPQLTRAMSWVCFGHPSANLAFAGLPGVVAKRVLRCQMQAKEGWKTPDTPVSNSNHLPEMNASSTSQLLAAWRTRLTSASPSLVSTYCCCWPAHPHHHEQATDGQLVTGRAAGSTGQGLWPQQGWCLFRKPYNQNHLCRGLEAAAAGNLGPRPPAQLAGVHLRRQPDTPVGTAA